MPLVSASENYMLDQWGTSKALFASLHTAYSATGTNELTGGAPAYARVAVTWSASSGGSKSLSGTYNLNVPASTTVQYIGFWDASTSGNFQGMFPNAAGANAFAFAAPSSTGVLLAPGSGYSANQTVVVFASPGSTLPSGLTAGTVYFVKSPSSDSFSLSATNGGAAITLTTDGSGIIQAIAAEVFASQGTFTITAGSLAIV